MRYLVTGGAGFIGHHVVARILNYPANEVVIIDRLDLSGNLARLAEGVEDWAWKKRRVTWVYHDLRAPLNDQVLRKIGQVDFVLHLAGSTHVDRSIEDPLSFVYDNVVGTCNLLDAARKIEPVRVVYFSTDEVFGPAPPGVAYAEDDRYRSSNPYSASKAGGEELAVAYANTYRMPIMITHTMNVFGPRQHPEKFIPGTIRKVLTGEKVTIHADATKTIPGSRFYIAAEDVADGLEFILGISFSRGEKFNIVGAQELTNLEVAQIIADEIGKPLDYELVSFHSSRPGHDLRYALSGAKLAALGWQPRPVEERLRAVVRWSLAHREWLGPSRY